MTGRFDPPALARRLIIRMATGPLAEDMVSELDEEYRGRVPNGLWAARAWYWRQVLLSIPALVTTPRSARQTARSGQGDGLMTETVRDVRLALRALRGSPLFFLVAIATLALGIGSSTAMFSVVNSVVLRPLPYRAPDRLVQVWDWETVSKETLARIREGTTTLRESAGLHPERAVLTGIDEPLELTGSAVSANYFDVLGVAPALGTFFRADQNEPGRGDAIVLSHGLWTSAFGRDPQVVGRQVTLAGRNRTVVGVTSPGHRSMVPGTEFWIPYVADPSDYSDYRGLARLHLIARLASGVTAAEAGAELTGLARQLRREQPESHSEDWVRRATVEPLAGALSATVASPLWTMLGAVAFVLLIACANVANLLLARSTGRSTEVAVRMGLGASRSRVVRQLLTESVVLGAMGGAAGLVLATATVRVVGAWLPVSVLAGESIAVDGTVFGFGLVVSMVSSLLFGVGPAMHAVRRGVATTLREGSRNASPGRRRHAASMGLVALQIAASVTLVTGAGLMLRSFTGLRAADPGFETDHVITMRVRLPTAARYAGDEQRSAFFVELDRQLQAVPGIRTAGFTSRLPMASGAASTVWSRPDRPRPAAEARPYANFTLATAGYFRALGVPILAGRAFAETDRADAPQVGLINQTLARDAFGGEDPIGRQLEIFGGGALLTIVGVVRDAHQERPEQAPAPEVFLPYSQVSFFSGLYLVARASETPAAAMAAVRGTVRALDPDVAVADPRTMDEVVATATADSRFFTWLVAAFGGLALLLGGVGIYGVLTYVVTERLPEFGIRMALGAPAGRVTREAMTRIAGPVGIGLVFGIAAAFGTTRALRSLLFGISPTDPLMFAAAPVTLVVVATVASYLAARRAGRAGLPAIMGR